jgi:hypothetical protein
MLDTTKRQRRRYLGRKRNRDYRERVASHQVVVPVVIDEHRIGLLLQLNYLREDLADNRSAIADAVARLLDRIDPAPVD